MKTLLNRIVAFVFLSIVIGACDKNDDTIIDNTPPLTANEISGTVTLPEGSTLDVNSLTVSSPVGTAIIENGTYRMDSLEDRFLTQLVGNENGDVYLMGYSYPGQTDFEISSTSTALAMLMNMAPSLLIAPEGKQELIAKILNHNELQALAAQIETSLVDNQSPLSLEQTELAQLVADFYDSVFAVSSNSFKKSDDESYPIDIRLTNNEITFVNLGKSYETVVGVYKDDQRIKKIEIDRVNFFPTTIGEVIGAAAAALVGDVPSGLAPVEYKYTLDNAGEYKIKVRTGDSDENDTETKEALLNNYENWAVDLLTEIVPLGNCFQPTIASLKQYIQSFTTLPIATTQQEKFGLVYDILFTFFNQTVTVVSCFVNVDDYKDYFKKLGNVLKWLDFVGKFGNAANIWVGIMQIDNDEGAMNECYKVEGSQVTECNEGDVYVAGQEYIGGVFVATVWKNGVATFLTDGSNDAGTRSVYVSGSDVYVAGYEHNGTASVATLWKNGEATSLTDGSNDVVATAVYVSGTDVYVVGADINENGIAVATVWKNGVATSLTDGISDAYTYSVYVSGVDVYVCGREVSGSGHGVATVWKNGIATSLTDGSEHARANSVYVSGNDVYVAGFEGNLSGEDVATVWKNGVATSLTDGSNDAEAYSIYVSGNDIYVSGKEDNGNFDEAKVWKNGEATSLTGGSSNAQARSIYVSGNDVYVTGYELNGNTPVATVWKNGEATSLSDGNNNAVAFSIFVR